MKTGNRKLLFIFQGLCRMLVLSAMFVTVVLAGPNGGFDADQAISLENTVDNVILKPIRGGGFAVISASGYKCSTVSKECWCSGGENSEDCIAMRENICREGEDLDCNIGGICHCSWGNGFSGGAGFDPLDTLPSY